MVQIQWALIFILVLVSSGLVCGGMRAAECAEAIRIGALTQAWGSTPQVLYQANQLLR